MGRRAGWIVLLVAAAWAGGCTGPGVGGGPGLGAGLRVGLGWSSADSPGEAGRAAMQDALAPLGGAEPDLVVVWDNWPTREDGRQLLAAVCRYASPRAVYGGHVAWPVATRWTTDPTVTVLALGGGWRVRAAAEQDVLGREEQAGRRLVEVLGLAPTLGVRSDEEPSGGVRGADEANYFAPVSQDAKPGTAAGDSAPISQDASPGATPPVPGDLVLVFGEAAGPRGRLLLRGIALRAGDRLPLLGGAGSGQAGSGWQYVAGRLTTDAVWAVRLSGPFAARAVWLTAEPDTAQIGQTASLATSLLAEGSARLPPTTAPDGIATAAPPWRLVLVAESAGWLAFLREPQQLALDAAERLAPPGSEAALAPASSNGAAADRGAPPGRSSDGPPANPAIVAGWAGDCQIGPQPEHGTLEAGQFALAMALIEPLPPPIAAPPGPPPATPPPPPTSQPASQPDGD